MAASVFNLRSWLNRHSGIATLAAVVLFFASVGVMANNLFRGPSYQPIDVYYYDLDTGELFVAGSDLVPPIAAPSEDGTAREPRGVRAYVYSCTSCDDEGARFVGMLEKYTAEARTYLENPATMEADEAMLAMAMDFERGHMMRAPDDRRWVTSESARAYKIMEAIQTRCEGDAVPLPCLPGR